MAAIIPDNPSTSQHRADRADEAFVELTTPLVESQIDAGDPDDPVARQFRIDPRESLEVPGFDADPVGDLAANAVPGVLHKYHGRALLVLTGACAVHCRYCFRRHFPYGDQRLDEAALDRALDYLADDPDMTEVILSGGDPLVLSSRRLAGILERLAALPHLRRLRIHSRIPTVSPERVDERLCEALAAFPVPVVLVAHVNHPRELAQASGEAFDRLQRAGVTLLNQSVLLHGVNDDAEVLASLSESLFDQGVLPYYLHHLDPVAGAAHFAVGADAGRALVDTLRSRLPGYLVPTFVVEQAGEPSKTPL
ncbi:EF-P beta-lysylation protein EpmB [Guyparkeria hydrothermalis]|uniref:EF-P beta-lysylation protein EpmB n=1 Tax=Guyparkeria hydrothermalis TaxID=923 RepID=UPI002020BCA3|nr:EF-P beta-lysylation protein EpmB [Guyparkeria hydrothermalis]MCL7743490.1 EF-P beta-lysylation protein EpmB [Guyparkeria hydrothermalis]